MCHTCNSEDTAYVCPECEREFLAEAHRETAQQMTAIFGLANAPSYLEEFATC